jgi:hypothetical protein
MLPRSIKPMSISERQEMAEILINSVKNHRECTDDQKHFSDGITSALYHLGYISERQQEELRHN